VQEATVRFILLSDIHGNMLALEAVLRDARPGPADVVACLGDTATLGPHPREVLRTLRELGGPCIMGNHDAFLVEPDLVRQYTQVPIVTEAIDWCRAQLSTQDLDFVRSFAPTLERSLGGGRSILLFHGSPESHMRDLLATTDDRELDACLGQQRAQVMAGGHTHLQLLRQHHGSWLVNPGSVGLPFRAYVAGKRPEIMAYAEYAIVHAEHDTLAVELKRVTLERAALRAATRAWPNSPPALRDDLLLQYA
jgi:predicted phosphodiesterase